MTDKRFAIKFLTFFLVSLFFSGCEKEKSPEDTLQDVVFGISHIDPLELKSDEFDIECPVDEHGNMLIPATADITVSNAEGEEMNFNPDVFYLNGQLYTKAIKLQPGRYSVTKFLLRDIEGTIVMATPTSDSHYAVYLNEGKTIEYTFDVGEFTKTEVGAEVLCFEPANYMAFGFFWFNIHQTVIKNFCFFGDICAMYNPEYQYETAYGGNTEGGNSPWWFFYDTTTGGSQIIYAGQQPTDGTVTINDNTLTIDLGSWSLQDVADPVKVQGFSNAPNGTPNPWTPPGQFEIKTDELVVDLSGHVYPYYIIHLDVRKETQTDHNFTGSLYEYVVNGLQMDIPAIFRIDVYKDGVEVPYSPFSNIELDAERNPRPIEEQTLNDDGFLAGTNNPVCAKYPVKLGETGQQFTFKLYILVPDDEGNFSFELFYTFTSTDKGPLINEENNEQIITDGVLDFVLGNCHYLPPDLLLEW